MMVCSEAESNVALSPDDFACQISVGPAVMESLSRYLSLLQKWQKRFNLVGRSTLDDPWRRHFLDSAQLAPFVAENPGEIIDMGSGAGFPGLVLSILGVPNVHLVECDANKAEFLRQVIRETGASARIHRERLEQYDGPDACCLISRACAPLDQLLTFGAEISVPDARALFLKGKTWSDELTSSQALWHIDHTSHSSLSDPNGIVLEIHEFKHR